MLSDSNSRSFKVTPETYLDVVVPPSSPSVAFVVFVDERCVHDRICENGPYENALEDRASKDLEQTVACFAKISERADLLKSLVPPLHLVLVEVQPDEAPSFVGLLELLKVSAIRCHRRRKVDLETS